MEKDCFAPVSPTIVRCREIRPLGKMRALQIKLDKYEQKIIEAVADTLTNTLGMPKGSFVYEDIMKAIKSVNKSL